MHIHEQPDANEALEEIAIGLLNSLSDHYPCIACMTSILSQALAFVTAEAKDPNTLRKEVIRGLSAEFGFLCLELPSSETEH